LEVVVEKELSFVLEPSAKKGTDYRLFDAIDEALELELIYATVSAIQGDKDVQTPIGDFYMKDRGRVKQD
ncbi:hypothetical protein FBU30_001619, partial [Linnemannia zychae]